MSTDTENSINQILETFEPITLEQMDEVSFLRRTDTKYVFHRSRLEALLKDMQDKFRLLIVKNSGIQKYRTVYFDTPLLDMYHQHHNGLRNRFKVRARQYINSNLFFLEVKVKNNKGITSKKRMKIDSLELANWPKESAFLADRTPFALLDLQESVTNEFMRITLLSKNTTDRITIDWNLSYVRLNNGEKLEIPNLCILEIKRNQNEKNRELDTILKESRIYPLKFSKYCMGLSLLETSLKTNRFKPEIHHLRKEEIIH